MRRRTLFLSLGTACAALAVRAAPSAQELLVASDAVRNPGRPFSVKVKLTEFEGGKQVETSSLVTYSRPQEQGGQYATLISFVQPARDAGKLLLKNGDDMWFYDPSTKASIRISPQQRLMGQAANGDVVTVNLAKDYTAQIKAEEEIVDGERKNRRTYLLALKASSPAAAYAEIELWVDTEGHRPLKARFMAESGRLLKTAYFRRYQSHLGKERPTETVIIDGLNPQAVTLMQFSDFATPSIPQVWFNRDYLPRFQRE
ncbi:MAG TPA: outer membrane lipoprotein-sorting protein [Aquabacterium sp.]|nr:outer membrane lipoprotein-sorting protein [Aquabacterium sp.]